MLHPSTLFLVFGVAGLVKGFYDASSPVKSLFAHQWKDEVLNSERVQMVEFFAPWCGHCQNLVPEYSKAAKNLKGMIDFVAIDCDDDKNKPLCGTLGIRGFPTIKLFYPKYSKTNPNEFKKISTDYNGERKAKALSDFAAEKLPSNVIQLTHGKTNQGATSHEEFIENDTISRVILFTDKPTTSTLYKSLSVEYKGRVLLSEAKGQTLSELYKVDKFPTLHVYPAGQKEHIVYDGKISFEALSKFLDNYSPEKEKKQATTEEEKVEVKPFDPNVPEISNQKDMEEHCLDKAGLCLLVVLDEEAEDHSESLETLKTLKKHDFDSNGPFHFAWVSSKRSSQLDRDFDLADSRPNVVILSQKKKTYRVMLGSWDVKTVEKFMQDTVSGKGRGILSMSFTPTISAVVKDEL